MLLYRGWSTWGTGGRSCGALKRTAELQQMRGCVGGRPQPSLAQSRLRIQCRGAPQVTPNHYTWRCMCLCGEGVTAENPLSYPQNTHFYRASLISRGIPITKPPLHPSARRDGCSPGQGIMSDSFYPEAADLSFSFIRPWSGRRLWVPRSLWS